MEFENDADATLTASASTAASISDLNTNAAPGPVGTLAQVAISCPGGDPEPDDGRQDLHGIANNRSDLMDLALPEALNHMALDALWQDVPSPAASRPGESYPSHISHESQQSVCSVAAAVNDPSDLNLQLWTESSEEVTVSDANTSCVGRISNSRPQWQLNSQVAMDSERNGQASHSAFASPIHPTIQAAGTVDVKRRDTVPDIATGMRTGGGNEAAASMRVSPELRSDVFCTVLGIRCCAHSEEETGSGGQ
jgi:hypothetical protein